MRRTSPSEHATRPCERLPKRAVVQRDVAATAKPIRRRRRAALVEAIEPDQAFRLGIYRGVRGRRNVCGVARDAPKADLPDETFEILVLVEHSNGRLLL